MERIDRKLRLIIELPRGESPSLYVHSEAMDADTFEQYFDLCGPTMNALVAGGYGYVAPRYAALMFRKVALAPLGPEQPDEAYARAKRAIETRVAGFFNELHRLTNVMAIKDGKWEMTLISDAVALGAVSQEEYSRIDATLVFFACTAQSVPLDKIEATLGGLSLFNSRTESLNAYGIREFLADVDAGREYWKESGWFARVLEWLQSDEGFRAFFSRLDESKFPWRTAASYRNRYHAPAVR